MDEHISEYVCLWCEQEQLRYTSPEELHCPTCKAMFRLSVDASQKETLIQFGEALSDAVYSITWYLNNPEALPFTWCLRNHEELRNIVSWLQTIRKEMEAPTS
jgi:hypothetical protein